MAANADLEKAEVGTVGTDSTLYASDAEEKRIEAEGERTVQGGSGVADPGHEEAEEMDAGHVKDLERQYVRIPHTQHRHLLTATDHNFYKSWPREICRR
jgi:hypothetical protein